MSLLEVVLAAIAAANGLATWLLKSRTDHKLKKLRAEHVHALEKLKADHDHALAKLALEHRIRFSTLHERRFEVVADVYRALAKADRALLVPGSPMWLGDEHHNATFEAFQAAGNEFREKFSGCRIFFPSDVGAKFDAYWRVMMQAGHAVADRATPRREERWYEQYSKASGEMAELKAAIELECRRLLGELDEGEAGAV